MLLGLEGSEPETIQPESIPHRYEAIKKNKSLILGGKHRIDYDMETDMLWRWDQVLPTQCVTRYAECILLLTPPSVPTGCDFPALVNQAIYLPLTSTSGTHRNP